MIGAALALDDEPEPPPLLELEVEAEWEPVAEAEVEAEVERAVTDVDAELMAEPSVAADPFPDPAQAAQVNQSAAAVAHTSEALPMRQSNCSGSGAHHASALKTVSPKSDLPRVAADGRQLQRGRLAPRRVTLGARRASLRACTAALREERRLRTSCRAALREERRLRTSCRAALREERRLRTSCRAALREERRLRASCRAPLQEERRRQTSCRAALGEERRRRTSCRASLRGAPPARASRRRWSGTAAAAPDLVYESPLTAKELPARGERGDTDVGRE